MDSDFQWSYGKGKSTLLDLTDRLKALLPEALFEEEIADIRRNLHQETFRLVVLGQFKRGKSTFINALLGQPVLPVDVIPTTTTITEIRYGQSPGATVYFHDGSSRHISTEALGGYIAESENPENTKGVDLVEVFYPAPFLADDIIVVDTPGVGSIHRHNSRLTREYLPRADAAVFLLSADPPLTEKEQQFLQAIYPVIPQVFFALNKKDYLDETSLHRVVQFNEKALKSVAGQDTKLAPISSLQGLQEKLHHSDGQELNSGFPEFETALQNFLVHRRGKFLLLSNMDRLLRVAGEWQNLVAMDMKARTLTLEQLSSNLEKFTDFVEQIKDKSGHLAYLAEGIKDRLLEAYDQEVREFVAENGPTLYRTFAEFVGRHKEMSNQALQKEAARQVNADLLEVFEPFRLRMQVNLKEKYSREIERLNREVSQILQELYDYSAALFRLSGAVRAGRDFWQYESQFTYRTWEVETTMDLVQNVVMTLLPRFVFTRILKQSGRKNITGKLGRQCGRLRADVLYGIRENNRQFVYKFSRVLDQIEAEIRKMIDEHIRDKQREETIRQQTVREQKMQLQQLESIRQETEDLKSHWLDEPRLSPSLGEK